jgi:hypothetical protein
MYNHRLTLDWKETAEDLLALIIKVLANPSENTKENRTHIAEACKSFTRVNPVSEYALEHVFTDDFIKEVIIPEVCDTIAESYIASTLQSLVRNVWDEMHPDQEPLPENLRNLCHTLRCDDSQTSNESWARASEIEREWRDTHNYYKGQLSHIIQPMLEILTDRMKEDVCIRPREFARREKE